MISKLEAGDTRNSCEDLWRSWPTIQGSISFEQLCLAAFENWLTAGNMKQDAAKVQQHPSTLNQVLTLIAKAHYGILDFQWFQDVMMSIVSDPGWSQHDHRDCWAPGRVSSGTIFLLQCSPWFSSFRAVSMVARFVRLLSLPPAPNDPITAGNLSHQLGPRVTSMFSFGMSECSRLFRRPCFKLPRQKHFRMCREWCVTCVFLFPLCDLGL